jgi:hypothetical protein
VDASGLDLNTLVTIGVFIAGVVAARWERGGQQHTKSVQVDTELRERVKYLEEKVRERGDDGKSIARLEVLYQNMARDLHELRSLMLGGRAPYALRRPSSPYDHDMRDWIDPRESPQG